MENDETFAYIAGYTDGGAAFGTTWEEAEEISINDILDSSPKDKNMTIIYGNEFIEEYFEELLSYEKRNYSHSLKISLFHRG
ncbi:hypothetical protein [Salipaludibacillus sp. CF4.18]|uniref:hypothetical protein n=1 Tax=Salipaludibacillus sp. CF4.18 TaxID=3373081 RepID=UPI003EE4ADEF